MKKVHFCPIQYNCCVLCLQMCALFLFTEQLNKERTLKRSDIKDYYWKQIFSYEIELVCTDHGQPALVSVRQLTVDVIDVNDVSPQFDRAVYVVDVLENSFVGAFVAQLNATDADSGANGRIVYGIDDDGGGGRVFEVDPDTGAVTTRAVLDREKTSRYRLRVRAVDGGNPTPLTGSAVLIVNVVDVDDERPQFLAVAYSFRVAENQPRGTEVGRLSAVDADSPTNVRLHFRLWPTNGEQDLDAFEIDQRTGAIATARPLDREHRALYVLVAEVFEVERDDDDDPTRSRPSSSAARALNSTAATVTIRVSDVNDNGPVFTAPQSDGNSSSVAVSNAARRGRVVATLTAVDADDGDNALVTYTIVAGNDRKLFRVDAHSGDVSADVDFAGDSDNQVRTKSLPYHILGDRDRCDSVSFVIQL